MECLEICLATPIPEQYFKHKLYFSSMVKMVKDFVRTFVSWRYSNIRHVRTHVMINLLVAANLMQT